MNLYAEVKFVCPKYAEKLGLIEYDSSFGDKRFSDTFEMNDIENQAYALRLLNDEFKSAVERVNKRLLAEGFGKESFRKPLLREDAVGNIVDINVP